MLKGRTVFIVFDAPTNEHLAASVSRAANFLMVRGAKVKVCSIENTEVYQRQAWDKDCGMTLKEFHDAGGTNKMGLDDFLRWGGKWNELTASAVEVENTIDQNTLFVSLALLTGPASPLYLHLTGKDAGTIRNKQAMSEVLSDELIWRETRGGVKPVNAFKEWCESPRRVKLNEVVVRPDLPPLSPTPDNNWNSWPGLVTLPLQNDALAAYFNEFLDEWFSPGVEDPKVALLHRTLSSSGARHCFNNRASAPSPLGLSSARQGHRQVGVVRTHCKVDRGRGKRRCLPRHCRRLGKREDRLPLR